MIFFRAKNRPILMCKSIEQAKKRINNGADLCKSIDFNLTNDEICVPRTPIKEEKEILDEIFKDSEYFSKLKTCAKIIIIF